MVNCLAYWSCSANLTKLNHRLAKIIPRVPQPPQRQSAREQGAQLPDAVGSLVQTVRSKPLAMAASPAGHRFGGKKQKNT
jgi:hypothetical protein